MSRACTTESFYERVFESGAVGTFRRAMRFDRRGLPVGVENEILSTVILRIREIEFDGDDPDNIDRHVYAIHGIGKGGREFWLRVPARAMDGSSNGTRKFAREFYARCGACGLIHFGKLAATIRATLALSGVTPPAPRERSRPRASRIAD